MAATPLAARCFTDRAVDILTADDDALQKLGAERAGQLRETLDDYVDGFDGRPSRWDARLWPHEDKKGATPHFALWDQAMVQYLSAKWLAANSPVNLPVAGSMSGVRAGEAWKASSGAYGRGLEGALLAAGTVAVTAAFAGVANGLSGLRTRSAIRRLDELSAHRSYTATPEMGRTNRLYNELLADLHPEVAAPRPGETSRRAPAAPAEAKVRPPEPSKEEQAAAARAAFLRR